jgi:hypothetical protein
MSLLLLIFSSTITPLADDDVADDDCGFVTIMTLSCILLSKDSLSTS